MKPRIYPPLAFNCPRPPSINPTQREAWCSDCDKKVHHLPAMSEAEQAELLRAQPDACVSYSSRRWLPAAVILLASGGALAESTEAVVPADSEEMSEIVVGGAAMMPLESVFLEAEPTEAEVVTSTPEDGTP